MSHRSARCPRCNGTVAPVRRSQSLEDALTNHLRIAHDETRQSVALSLLADLVGDDDRGDDLDDQTAIDVTMDVNDVFRSLGSRMRVNLRYVEMERLPFFVYGTLRPGFGNSRLWEGKGRGLFDGVAWVDGFKLIGQGIPYAVPEAGRHVVGCLVVVAEDRYAEVAQDLDRLEGYPSHYDRIEVDVATPNGPRRAWMYSPPSGRSWYSADPGEVGYSDYAVETAQYRARLGGAR